MPNSTTTTTVGTDTRNASPPVCFGPKTLSDPMITIATAAYRSGCDTLKYSKAESALNAAVTM